MYSTDSIDSFQFNSEKLEFRTNVVSIHTKVKRIYSAEHLSVSELVDNSLISLVIRIRLAGPVNWWFSLYLWYCFPWSPLPHRNVTSCCVVFLSISGTVSPDHLSHTGMLHHVVWFFSLSLVLFPLITSSTPGCYIMLCSGSQQFHLHKQQQLGNEVFPKWSKIFIEFSEFRESEKSLNHELG